jgi:uncharacterized protein
MAPTERMVKPPSEGVREAPFIMRAVAPADDEPGDGLTMDGWGSVFNRTTVIDSWEGRFRELFAPGSMKKSFRENPPKIQFDHGRHPLIGSIPVASLRSIGEDVHPEYAPEGGAHIVARIFDNWLMQPLRDAIQDGAINGMSHRFSVVRESWCYADGTPIRDERDLMAEMERAIYDNLPEEELPIRTVKEARIAEMGPVVWPAYQETSVGVRSLVIDLGALRRKDPEQRKLLAEAVFIAEAATETQDEEAQRDTTTADVVAVEHSSDSDDAPQDAAPRAVVEHPSIRRGYRPIDLVLRNTRDVMLTIKQKGS